MRSQKSEKSSYEIKRFVKVHLLFYLYDEKQLIYAIILSCCWPYNQHTQPGDYLHAWIWDQENVFLLESKNSGKFHLQNEEMWYKNARLFHGYMLLVHRKSMANNWVDYSLLPIKIPINNLTVLSILASDTRIQPRHPLNPQLGWNAWCKIIRNLYPHRRRLDSQ